MTRCCGCYGWPGRSAAGPPLEQLIDLPHQRPGPGQVGEGEMDAGELDPDLDGQLGHRVGQHMPQPLGTDELPARRRDICPVQGCAGLHRTDQRRGVAVLDPGPAQHAACLSGQALGPAPVTARHRHQRPLAQRDRESLMRADLLPGADGILEGCVAAIKVTGKYACQPLVQRWCR